MEDGQRTMPAEMEDGRWKLIQCANESMFVSLTSLKWMAESEIQTSAWKVRTVMWYFDWICVLCFLHCRPMIPAAHNIIHSLLLTNVSECCESK